MKMPAILSRDTGAKIDQARKLLAASEVRLVQLETERADALANGDSMDAARKLGVAIAEERREAADLRDRIAALSGRKREEDAGERERARQEAIDKSILPAAAQCVDLAVELERMLARSAELLDQIEQKRQVMNTMPPGVPRPQFYRGASFNLSALRIGDLGSLKRSCAGIAAMVRADLDRFIAACRQEPLPAPADDDVEEAA